LNELIDLSPSAIISSLFFSIIGLYVFRRAKKLAQHKLIVLGILLMTYSYFTKGPLQDWGGGLILLVVTIYYWDRDD